MKGGTPTMPIPTTPTMTREFSFSVQTTLDFQPCLDGLRECLRIEGFRIVAEIPFHHEFKKNVGLAWQRYTVLVVWSPFYAYQALLSDRDGGLIIPFNLVVAETDASTLLVATNHGFSRRVEGPIGTRVLVRELNQKILQILLHIAANAGGRGQGTALNEGQEAR